MSSVLSDAENVAQQRQNVRRDLKQIEEESRAVELALEVMTFVYFLSVRQNVSSTVMYIYIYIFGNIVSCCPLIVQSVDR